MPTMIASVSCRYEVEFCDGLPSILPEKLITSFTGRKALVITTPTVARLLAERFVRAMQAAALDVTIHVVPMGEAVKTPETLLHICQLAQRAGLGRTDVMVALGGGVCCDLVTTAAAIYRRGIDYICIPTTLIGQVDAAVGVKGAVNFNGAKSMLGVFHAPHSAWIDTALLRTLPAAAISDGLAEILKLALSCDASLFELLEQEGEQLLATRFAKPAAAARTVVERSVALTLQELGSNLYERHGLRRLLDFGHTFSPTIEAISDYRLSHGQAVSIDMAYSTAIAAKLGMIEPRDAHRVYRLMDRLDLPRDWRGLDVELARRSLKAASAHRGGAPNLVLPKGVGRSAIIDDIAQLPDKVLGASLAWMRGEGSPAIQDAPVAQGAL